MNVLFEEDGAFRAGAVLADNNTSLQVELPTGKRSKVKAANVLLRFEKPAPAELMQAAESGAAEIDTDFLWQVCPAAEFGFEQLAADYYGRKPVATDAAAVLLRLHSAPMYFHRKGKGHFRRAPPEILQAALAGLEKKKLQALAIERMMEELAAGALPTEFVPLLPQLLYAPDRNRPETKALEAACATSGLSAPQLLEKCGAIRDTHAYHLGRFLFEYFPRGTDFPACAPPTDPTQPGAQRPISHPLPVGENGVSRSTAPSHPSGRAVQSEPSGGRGDGTSVVMETLELPLAEVQAFSIDDAHTTEIDDAFSVVFNADGGMRIGIHIAAPGLGITSESDLGRVARSRLSTVYMPGRKITMLPEDVVEHFTLAAGSTVPALSLYLDVASDLRVIAHETKLERVTIAANLRHHDIEPLFNEETLATGLSEFPLHKELKQLWELATVLEAGRGRPSAKPQQKDYNFIVDWNITTDAGPGRVSIEERPRGSPLDKLVAELMIVTNATWGKLLDEAKIPALYRAQSLSQGGGKVRMTTVAAPHEGLGVDCYAWSSSPLRRFVDLVNQWQLIAHLRGESPPYPPKSAELLAALRDFELTYAAYAEFQRGMERYWCLRWLMQEALPTLSASVVKESLVRVDGIPLLLRVPSLPALDTGVRVTLQTESIDLLAAEVRARFVELLGSAGPAAALEDDSPSE